MANEFDEGLLTGLLISGGHFGGDGRQPQITLRLHLRHEALLRWLDRTFPGGRLYGPYHHAGREYLQWMARGPYLREHLVPLLERHLSPALDGHSWDRFEGMRHRYVKQLGNTSGEAGTGAQKGKVTQRSEPLGGHGLPAAELSRRVEEAFARLHEAGEDAPEDSPG